MKHESAPDRLRTGLSATPPTEQKADIKEIKVEVTEADIQAEKARISDVFQKEISPVLDRLNSLASAVFAEDVRQRLQQFTSKIRGFYNKNDHALAYDGLTLSRLQDVVELLDRRQKLSKETTNAILDNKPDFIGLENDLANPSVASFKEELNSAIWKRKARQSKEEGLI